MNTSSFGRRSTSFTFLVPFRPAPVEGRIPRGIAVAAGAWPCEHRWAGPLSFYMSPRLNGAGYGRTCASFLLPTCTKRIDRRGESANRFHVDSKFAVCFLVANRHRLYPWTRTTNMAAPIHCKTSIWVAMVFAQDGRRAESRKIHHCPLLARAHLICAWGAKSPKRVSWVGEFGVAYWARRGRRPGVVLMY